MKLKNCVLVGITVLSMGIGFQINQTSVHAAVHYMPKSWRGSYYTTSGRSLSVKAYSVAFDGKTLYKSSGHGWHRISFSRVGNFHHHKVYQFNNAKYEYQSSHMWRIAYKHGHKELINYAEMGYVQVWHKY